MSPEFRSLLRKDWTERRSLFWFALVFVVGFLGYCIAYELEYRTRTFIAGYYHTCQIFGQLGSVLLAMTVVTGEYSKRTAKFSASLPVSLSAVGWSRLLVAWGYLVIPMLLGGIIVTLILASGIFEQAGLRSDDVRLPDRPSLTKIEAIGFLWTTVTVAVACALQLVTLLSWLGTRCRTEGTVGFIGVIVILFSQMFTAVRQSLDFLGLFLLSDWIGSLIPNSLLISWGYGELDGSSYTDLDLAPLVVGPLILNLLITFAMAARFASRYGRRMELGETTASRWRKWIPSVPSRFAWLPVPQRSQMGSLVWLNARESVPLSLAGLFIAVLIALIGILLNHSRQKVSFDQLRVSLPENTWFVGIFWGAVVAIGVFGPELKVDLEQFWRSRPIAPRQWFWIKFIIGLIAVLGTLDGIPALIAWNVPYAMTQGRMGFVYLACMPLIHALVYAIAVAAICQLRRPIPAAMIAILLFFVIEGVLESIPVQTKLSTIHVYNSLNAAQARGENLDLTSHGYPIVYGFVFAIFLLAIALARRSIMPARAANLGVLIAIALALCSSGQARGDEAEIVKDIMAGFRAREVAIKDVHLRFKAIRHRTDVYYEVESASRGRFRGRQRGGSGSSTIPRDEELTYDVFERLPCRVWTTFGPEGTVKSMSAFDGTTQRDYTAGIRKAAQGTIMNTTQGSRPTTADPDSSLMACGGLPLIGILERGKLQQAIRRDVDGEQLVDLAISNQFSYGDANGSPSTQYSKYEVTVNVSHNYWPVRVRQEISKSLDGIPFSIIEVKANGWIDAKPIVYPRHTVQTAFISVSAVTGGLSSIGSAASESTPELSETQEVEITEIALNTDFSEDVFQPAFPAGAVVSDIRNGKQYEADAGGELQVYVPKPAGFRGAVFIYHLIWISMAVAFLFIRRTDSASPRPTTVFNTR